jgi:multidrug efflux system membrane fusion protein
MRMERLLSKSSLIALVIGIAVVAWMASGTVTSPGSNAAESASRSAALRDVESETGPNERAGVRVGVRHSNATAVDRVVAVSARTLPNRVVEIRGEAEGRVMSIEAERGALVRAGQPLVRLDLRDREARLAEAQALLEQNRMQYEAAQSLGGENLLSEVQIAETRARLVSAEASLRDIELEIERTVILAPFDGIVQERLVEVGDLVRIGDTIAEFVDTDPMIVVGDVNEREIAHLTTGRAGLAILPDGTTVEGNVRYIAPVADDRTRTFRVELAVPNPSHQLRAGVTAELKVTTDEIKGHLLSPALLTLDDEGTIGVKIVDAASKAKFIPVEILRSEAEGVWVTGLPEAAEIIAIGQGFVVDGQLVDSVPADGITGSAAQL